jgi:hypothetical protein
VAFGFVLQVLEDGTADEVLVAEAVEVALWALIPVEKADD